jgi:hypothetical protein
MKRILPLTLAVSLLTAVPAFATLDGAWTASADAKRADRFHMQVTRDRNHNMGMTMRIAEFSNLTAAQMNATTMTPVQFELRREAGNTSFEGSFRNGKGAGQFTFAGNRAYLDTLRSLGVEDDLRGRKKNRDEEETLFTLAIHDVSTAFIRSMRAEGFNVSLEKYLSMRIFDITPEYIREMRELGFRDMDVDELVGTRIHKVTPAYVRKMRAAGWNLSLDELQSTAIHGATPEFAEEMRKLGYADLDIDDLVSFRIHKVTPAFITELRELGYTNVKADDLVSMRIHRVTPEFIRELAAAGYKNVPVRKLVEMRIHRIDAKMLKAMSDS